MYIYNIYIYILNMQCVKFENWSDLSMLMQELYQILLMSFCITF